MTRAYLRTGLSLIIISIVLLCIVVTLGTVSANQDGNSEPENGDVWSREHLTERALRDLRDTYSNGLTGYTATLENRAYYYASINLIEKRRNLQTANTIIQGVACNGRLLGVTGFPRSKENCRIVLMFMDGKGSVVIYKHKFSDNSIEHFFLQTMYPAELVTVKSMVSRSKMDDNGCRVLNESDFDDSLKLRVPYDAESVLALEMPDGLLTNFCSVEATGSGTLEEKFRWLQEQEE